MFGKLMSYVGIRNHMVHPKQACPVGKLARVSMHMYMMTITIYYMTVCVRACMYERTFVCMYVYAFLTHPCRRQPLKIFIISNDRGRSLLEAFDWLFIYDDPSDVRDLRVKVVVEIDTQ